MRVLIVNEGGDHNHALREGVLRSGHEAVAFEGPAGELLHTVERVGADIILIHAQTPSRDVLEQLGIMNRERPRPVVVFAADGGSETIRKAVKAGVASYIVDGLESARVQPILEVAMARFETYQQLRSELAAATLKLSERKLIERAKGLLMKNRGLAEDEAYAQLRKLAMSRGKRLGEVAQGLIDAAALLN